MKKILVPTDFSQASRNAGEYAAALARAFAAEVYLVHVFMEPVPATEVPVAWMINPNELQEEFDAGVQKEVAYLKNKYPVEVSGCARKGYKGDTINEVAKEVQADLIVMGMKENRSAITGSTTWKEIRKSQIPVLIVPQAASFIPIRHIVFACDFHELSEVPGFELVFRIAEKFGAALQVIHVQKKEEEMAASEVPGKLQMGRILSPVSFSYLEVTDDSVEHGILDFLQNHPADLLMMVAHHHHIFERIFGLVHTRSVSLEIKLPLLILKEKNESGSSQ